MQNNNLFKYFLIFSISLVTYSNNCLGAGTNYIPDSGQQSGNAKSICGRLSRTSSQREIAPCADAIVKEAENAIRDLHMAKQQTRKSISDFRQNSEEFRDDLNIDKTGGQQINTGQLDISLTSKQEVIASQNASRELTNLSNLAERVYGQVNDTFKENFKNLKEKIDSLIAQSNLNTINANVGRSITGANAGGSKENIGSLNSLEMAEAMPIRSTPSDSTPVGKPDYGPDRIPIDKPNGRAPSGITAQVPRDENGIPIPGDGFPDDANGKVAETTFDSNMTAQKAPDYDSKGNPLPPWPVAPPSKTAQTHEGEFDPARPEKEPFAPDKTAQKGPDYDSKGNPLPPWPIAPPKTAGLVGTQGGCKTGQIIGSDGQCRGGSPVSNLTAAAEEEAQNLGIEPQRQLSSEGTIQTAGMRDDIEAIRRGAPVKTIIPGAPIQKQLQKAK